MRSPSSWLRRSKKQEDEQEPVATGAKEEKHSKENAPETGDVRQSDGADGAEAASKAKTMTSTSENVTSTSENVTSTSDNAEKLTSNDGLADAGEATKLLGRPEVAPENMDASKDSYVKEEGPPASSDTAEYVLCAEFFNERAAGTFRTRRYADAVDLVVRAIKMVRNGPTGVSSRRPGVDWGLVAWVAASLSACIFTLAIVLLLARASVRQAAAKNGILVAVGLPAVPGREPILAMGAAVQHKSLIDVASMPFSTLRNIRDVTLVHRGTWRCLRISRSVRFGESHVLLEAPDGSALRIRNGQAALRVSSFGAEEPINSSAATYEDHSEILETTDVVPSAAIDLVATFPA
eukprot:TRINITY_DN48545_c0_g1_i1.p1 TRINITY_DN48545_c0_g1~~TRINITY_DN48545_c0_g1_i1.p1  ORF type:complete len:350 (-),score=50.33 TRINITY_DN48545_c0_g1_i1:162-1211(-)